jgi:hypothetical protein
VWYIPFPAAGSWTFLPECPGIVGQAVRHLAWKRVRRIEGGREGGSRRRVRERYEGRGRGRDEREGKEGWRGEG